MSKKRRVLSGLKKELDRNDRMSLDNQLKFSPERRKHYLKLIEIEEKEFEEMKKTVPGGYVELEFRTIRD